MQAVVLAAGRSTRTFPLTRSRPKPLIPLWGRPFLEHQLRQLVGVVDEVLLVVGYRREQIEAHFGGSCHGLPLRYVHQTQQRGTADAVLAARPLVRDSVLIVNGDDFYHRDDLTALAATGRGLLISRAPDPENRAVVTLDDDAVVDIVEKPKSPPRDAWCSVGGYCLQKDDLRLLDFLKPTSRGELELPDLVLRVLEHSRVRPSKVRRLWLPLTYAWDILSITIFLWNEPSRALQFGLEADEPDALRRRKDLSMSEGVRIEGKAFIGENVRLGEGSRLEGPLAIGPGCRLGANVQLRRSVLFERVRVADGARIEDSILGARVSVGAGARLQSRSGSELALCIGNKTIVPAVERLGTIAGDDAAIEAGATLEAGSLVAADDG